MLSLCYCTGVLPRAQTLPPSFPAMPLPPAQRGLRKGPARAARAGLIACYWTPRSHKPLRRLDRFPPVLYHHRPYVLRTMRLLSLAVLLGLLTGLAFYPAVAVWVGRFIPRKSGGEALAGPRAAASGEEPLREKSASESA